MPTLTINGTSFPHFLSAFSGDATSPAAGQYYALPPYGKPPTESAPQYDDRHIQFPGNFATGTKRLLYNGRIIHTELIVCNTTKAGVMGAAATILESFAQLARYTITLPDGISRDGCKLVTAQESDAFSVGTSYCVCIIADFIQLQEPGY